MPMSAPRICTHAGCDKLTSGSRCVDHPYSHNNRSAKAKDYNRLYKTARWLRVRKSWLIRHPICVDCESRDVVRPATIIDHIIAHDGDVVLFWDSTNYQSLCVKCHNRKTSRHDRRDRQSR